MQVTEDGKHMYGDILDCGVSSFFCQRGSRLVRGPSKNFHVVCAVALFGCGPCGDGSGGTCERHKKPM